MFINASHNFYDNRSLLFSSIYSQIIFVVILGVPGADSGAEDENQNGREKIRRAKVRKKKTSPWGQTLYAPVPNGRTNTRS